MEMNKKKYKLAIFDVDGTLLDTSEGLLNSTIYTIKQLGYPMPSQEVLLSFIGPRIQDSFQRVYGLQGNELNEASTVFRNHYKEGDVLLAKPYDGVYEILDWLKERKIHMAVATNKRQDFADKLMKKYNFMSYIELVYGTDFEGKLRKTDLIRMCIEKFPDCRADEVVMIGDSSYDAIAAQEAGVNFIGVTFGFEFSQKEDLNTWKNAGYADSFRALKDNLI